jgi:ELWxxDGT repeat protein
MKRKTYSGFIILLTFLVNSNAFSQASLIKDLFPGDTLTTNGDPDNLLKINGIIYFTANNEYGNELWKTDGTEAGTALVKNINTGSNNSDDDSDPVILTDVNGVLFFWAKTNLNGKELWKSDGTEAGTVLLKDINPGIGPGTIGTPQKMVNFNGLLYFVAFDPISGQELWKSDGTSVGTEMAIDFTPGSGSSSISDLTVVNGVLYFSAYNDLTNDTELWRTDGTTSGTILVKDINPGIASSIPGNLFDFNGELFFLADDGVSGRELWKSDGTEAGTVMVKDINTGSGNSLINYLTVCNNTIYFSASNGSTGSELWKSDGTEAGTELVKDINSGLLGSDPQNFVVMNQIIYFSAIGSSNEGIELWKTDGTETGTVLVKDINTGYSSSNPGNKVLFGNTFYFAANDAVNGRELWKSDGTEVGTVLIKNIHNATNSANPDFLTVLNNELIFTATNFQHGKELWKSDGTESGTQILREIGKQPNSSDPLGFAVFNNEIYFSAYVGGDFNSPNFTGGELWKTDGTAQGTVLVKDIEPGPGGYGAANMTVCNNTLFFTYQTNADGTELWKTDGTAAGTVMVKNISSLSTGSSPSSLTVMNNTLYFVANDGSNGKELWKSDGTSTGTILVKNINQYSNSSNPDYLTVLGQELFFSASDGVNGNELWKTDGTEPGTVLVKDIKSGFSSSSPKDFSSMNGAIYFRANDGINGEELWKTDGTVAGTVLVKDILPGTGSSLPNEFTAVGNDLFFTVMDDNIQGSGLWKTDGTEAGTVMVFDFVTSTGTLLTEAGGILYFVNDDANFGWELWKSDGSAIGTMMVKDICPGILGSGASNLKNINGALYFTANDEVFGVELWKSNGTECGTQLLADINPGILGIFNSGNEYIAHNDAVYLNAANKNVGNEIWRINVVDNLDEYAFNTFVLPSETNSCTGELSIEFENLGPYSLSISSGQSIDVTGNANFTGYCPGIYDLSISDACGNNYNTYFIVPADSNYIYINPFQDSIALDSLGHIIENCEIIYGQIDTAYIDSIWATGNTVNVIWNIVDSNGSNLDTTSYVLNNGNGIYWLQLSVFCPFKSVGEYFTVTEAISFNNGHVSTAGLDNVGANLFEIYPNPTNDQVHINFSGSEAELTVYDAQGKMVLKDRIQNQEIISLQNFERGVYLFDFKNSNGRSVQRVVKQ